MRCGDLRPVVEIMTCDLCDRYDAKYQRVINYLGTLEVVEVCEHCEKNFCPVNGYHIVLPADTDMDPEDATYPPAVSKAD